MRGGGRVVAYWLLVVGLAGGGLAAASAGRAADPPPVRASTLDADLRCRHIPRNIDFTGTVHVTMTVPTSVAPGERFTIRPTAVVTLDPAVAATPVNVRLFTPVVSGGGVITIALPVDVPAAFTLQAGVREPVVVRFTIPSTVTARMAGTDVECFTTGTVTGDVSVPVTAPGDGSQQAYDAVATASCTDETRTFAHDFGMHGVAPASVAPGEPVSLTFTWQGLASMLQDRGTATVSGTVSGPTSLTFATITGSVVHLDTGPAGPAGEVRVQLGPVDSSLQAGNPPHVNYADCTFPDGGPTVVVPISATAATTAAGHPLPSPLLALLRRLLCSFFRLC